MNFQKIFQIFKRREKIDCCEKSDLERAFELGFITQEEKLELKLRRVENELKEFQQASKQKK